MGSAVPYPIGGDSPLNEAIRCHELVVVPSDIPRQANHGRAAAHTIPQLHEGDITFPLMSGSRALGAIVVAREGRILRSEQREFLLAAGRQTAQALDRARSVRNGGARPCGGRSAAGARGLGAARAAEGRGSAASERNAIPHAGRPHQPPVRVECGPVGSRLAGRGRGRDRAPGKVVVGAAAGSVALLATAERSSRRCTARNTAASPTPDAACRSRGGCARRRRSRRNGRSLSARSSSGRKSTRSPPRSPPTADTCPRRRCRCSPMARSFGVLSFHFTVPVNFDDEYSALLTSVAQHCAQALDRARLYEAAERARREAEAANRSKDDFLSTISHELRTPLNAMLGWAAMLRNGVGRCQSHAARDRRHLQQRDAPGPSDRRAARRLPDCRRPRRRRSADVWTSARTSAARSRR